MNPLKQFFAWLDGEVSRGRRVILFSIIGAFILMTYVLLAICALGYKSNIETFFQFYVTFAASAVTPVIGFYTMTSPVRANVRTGEIEHNESKVDKTTQT